MVPAEKAKKLRELAACCEAEACCLDSEGVKAAEGEAGGWELLILPLISALIAWLQSRKK